MIDSFDIGADITAELLSTHGLSKRFGSRRDRRQGSEVRAVDGVDITVNKGETLGVVGETGSGKTTLGRLLIGLEKPSSGSVVLSGVELSSLSGRQLRDARQNIQMIFQDPLGSLDPRWTVRRVLAEPLRAHGIKDPRQVEDQINSLIWRVGLDATILSRRPIEMSGGQRQRVGIARALALHPQLIIADEPVSALDVSVQAQIVNLLKDLQRDLGLGLVFIAHGLEVVYHIADRVAVMYLGRVVEIGETSSLFSAPAHPYTESLLGAAPRPDPRKRRELKVISGEIGSASHLPAGCRFHPRCPNRTEICEVEDPELQALTGNRWVACHHPSLVSRAGGSSDEQTAESG
ncbi:MAG: ABC transporter ATP-binding protein [Ferrimicrobium sp.]|jgi:peptide/nickel transport system ATP-binding protein|uniref:ABC transporter ATP-binding protein n=1 Tax=Ferrimicrobium acidiphilum TaxID=121039 RepID=A0ABV3Y4W2_9ACTN|nr:MULTISPECIES: oligopeptide/dipeptide ABC transporter ATP-binding protein [Ferrimicrobium]